VSRVFPRRLAWIFAFAPLLAPQLARAAEASEEHGLGPVIWHAANLVVFLFILIKFIGPQLREFLFQRRKTIESQLDEARRLLDSAKARDEEWRGKLEGLKAEGDRIIKAAGELGRVERERILDLAARQAERIRGDAERAAAQEVARAKSLLREEAVRLAMILAERLVKENVNEADQERLVEEYLRSMESRS
jgi:F-type H+-transporting ATPase subunit b